MSEDSYSIEASNQATQVAREILNTYMEGKSYNNINLILHSLNNLIGEQCKYTSAVGWKDMPKK